MRQTIVLLCSGQERNPAIAIGQVSLRGGVLRIVLNKDSIARKVEAAHDIMPEVLTHVRDARSRVAIKLGNNCDWRQHISIPYAQLAMTITVRIAFVPIDSINCSKRQIAMHCLRCPSLSWRNTTLLSTYLAHTRLDRIRVFKASVAALTYC